MQILKWMKTVWDLGILQQAFDCLCIPRWLDRSWDTLYGNLIKHSSVASKKKQIGKTQIDNMFGTLFSSTIDLLLIYLPCTLFSLPILWRVKEISVLGVSVYLGYVGSYFIYCSTIQGTLQSSGHKQEGQLDQLARNYYFFLSFMVIAWNWNNFFFGF